MKNLLFMTTLFLSLSGFAQSSDKMDLDSLEKKYWSAKDDDFSVVQNRAFPKAKRYFVNVAYGSPINDPYSTGSMLQLTGGYFWNERWGLEFSHNQANLRNNEATAQFITDHGTIPNHNIYKGSDLISGVFVPFYAKMSFLDKKIVYFDMSFSLGLGMSKYEVIMNKGNEIKSSQTIAFDVSQHFFFSENVAVRVDFKNKWTPEDRERYAIGTDPESARSLGTKNINDTALMIGLTYWH